MSFIQAIIQSQQSSSKVRKITSGRAIRGSLARDQSSFHIDQQTFQELSTIKFFYNYIQKQILLSNPIKDFSFLINNNLQEMQKNEIRNLMKWNDH